MSDIISTILSQAGFAGAVLIVCGYALYRKDLEAKTDKAALVKQAEKHSDDLQKLHEAFVVQLQAGQDRRTADAQRYADELVSLSKKSATAMQDVAVTNTEVRGTLLEVRREIRYRNRKPSEGEIPQGGAGE